MVVSLESKILYSAISVLYIGFPESMPRSQGKLASLAWFLLYASLKTSFNLEILGKKFVHPKVISKYFGAYLTMIFLIFFIRYNIKEEEVLSGKHFWTIQNPLGGLHLPCRAPTGSPLGFIYNQEFNYIYIYIYSLIIKMLFDLF